MKPTFEGWYWYRFESITGIHVIPVYAEQDSSGIWFISEAPGPEEDQPLGYIEELDGELVGWIGNPNPEMN